MFSGHSSSRLTFTTRVTTSHQHDGCDKINAGTVSAQQELKVKSNFTGEWCFQQAYVRMNSVGTGHADGWSQYIPAVNTSTHTTTMLFVFFPRRTQPVFAQSFQKTLPEGSIGSDYGVHASLEDYNHVSLCSTCGFTFHFFHPHSVYIYRL